MVEDGASVQPPEVLSEPVRLQRRAGFDVDVELYAARRPTYPAYLFDTLDAYADLRPGARVLEVAPGTGQATRALGLRGWTVTAIELGAQMAAVARRHVADLPGISVEVSAFEDWPLPSTPFDAVFCATAWHWLDPATRLTKTSRALRPGGTLAVVWTHYVAGGTTAFFNDVQRAYAELGVGGAWSARRPREEDLTPSTGEVENSPLFADVEHHRFATEVTYDRQSFVELARTYSEVIALPSTRRAQLLEHLGELIDRRYGGEITARYVFELVLSRSLTTEDGLEGGRRTSS